MTQEALIVIDVQNDFCPGGALGVAGGDEIVPLVNRLITNSSHVILTQDWHAPGHQSFASSHPNCAPFSQKLMPYGMQTLWPDHCLAGSHGAHFHEDLITHTARLILRKGTHLEIDSYSAFFDNDHKTSTGLCGYLQECGIKKLTFCGLATDFCVAWSALDAVRLGFQASAVLGACRAIDLDDSLNTALHSLRESGVELLLTP